MNMPDGTAITTNARTEVSTEMLSVVIPVFNEEDSLRQLHSELTAVCSKHGGGYEIIFLNDGCSDNSPRILDELAEQDDHVVVVHFRRNFGKSSALAAGFELARGDFVLTLDADLQDDPAMIPQFIERLRSGADLVSGWKQRRNDPVDKTLPSKVFNFMVRKLVKVELQDMNCGFKGYRRECVQEISVYGDMHRFLPVLAAERGFRIEELPVEHRARMHGVSKYGWKRFFTGFFDILTVLFVTRFRTQPLHFFAPTGLFLGFWGVGILVYLSVLWFQGAGIGSRPLLTLGVLLTMTAVQLVSIGLIGELLVRSTVKNKEKYSIRKIVRRLEN